MYKLTIIIMDKFSNGSYNIVSINAFKHMDTKYEICFLIFRDTYTLFYIVNFVLVIN